MRVMVDRSKNVSGFKPSTGVQKKKTGVKELPLMLMSEVLKKNHINLQSGWGVGGAFDFSCPSSECQGSQP